MAKKINQARPEGAAQPEIRPGDKWRDKTGATVTIQQYAHNRVTYIREGYGHECICSPDRLRREFSRVSVATFTEWREARHPLEKTQKLRALITASREGSQ